MIKGKIIVGHSLWNDLSGTYLSTGPKSFRLTFLVIYVAFSVLGIPHPAVATRDVALYVPFRNALSSPNQIIGLQTLMWHLMSRRIQDQQQNPVSTSRTARNGVHRHTHVQIADSTPRSLLQLENARAALDLYRSHSTEWESAVSSGNWPSALPPSTFSRCYL
jgi:RNA exonuclease 4